MLSVSSSSSSSGARPVSATIVETERNRPGACTWRAERLTAILGAKTPARCHSPTCRHAVRSTHSPIGTMRPFCSATGMNSSGSTSPRSGCCQRISASMPAMRPSFARICGW